VSQQQKLHFGPLSFRLAVAFEQALFFGMHQKKASFFLHLSFILGVPMEFVVYTKVPKPSNDKTKRDSFQLHLNEARITTTFWITPC